MYSAKKFLEKREFLIDRNKVIQEQFEKLNLENQELKERCNQLESENKIVQWYLEVMEAGLDTREYIQFYKDAKKTIKDLSDKYERLK